MHTFLQDLRYAFRQFSNHPGFALTAVLSLALGIGAAVSVFSIVYAVLMNPWPYAGADRVCNISLLNKAGEGDNWSGLTGPQISQLRPGSGFQSLGLPAMLGRNFLPSDAPDGWACCRRALPGWTATRISH
jgi:putative ABC transport system permease protein